MPNKIADRLKSRSEKIMELWTTRAQTEIASALNLEKLALRDSLPEFLSQVVDALSNTIERTPLRIASDKLDSTRIGHDHGYDRASFSHFSIDQVIFEFHLLREIIFRVMEEEAELPSRERDIIISSIEQAVNDSASEFAKVLREIRQKLVDTLTHDLRTPITITRASAEIIMEHPEDVAAVRKYAKLVVTNMERVRSMIRDLLDVSRIRFGQKVEFEFHEINLARLLKDVCEELTIALSVKIVYKATEPINGYWSESGIRRLTENLVSNAAKYGLPNSKITVSLNQADQVTKLEVHNLGKPIAKVDIPTLFEQFQRGVGTAKKEGWGVGLSIVKGVTEAHKGKIEVESSEEKGTSFIILLPNDYRKIVSRMKN